MRGHDVIIRYGDGTEQTLPSVTAAVIHLNISASRLRISKLDIIVSNLYEDNLEGKISDERFKRMSSTNDEEHRLLEERVKELQEYIEASKG